MASIRNFARRSRFGPIAAAAGDADGGMGSRVRAEDGPRVGVEAGAVAGVGAGEHVVMAAMRL